MIDMGRVGISSPLFSFSSIEHSLKEISHRFERWEIVAELEHTSRALMEKKDLLLDSGLKITVHAPFADLNLASLDQRVRELSIERIEEALQASHELGSEIVTIHPGFFSPLGFLLPERVNENNSDSIARLSREAEELGVTLALENMPPWKGSMGDSMDDLIDRIEGTGARICFDVGHAHIGGAIEGFIGRSDLIANVHIHENDGKDDLHLPIGSKDVIGVMEKLEARGYRGPYIIESRDLEEGIQSLKYLEKVAIWRPTRD
jgi:sugar phosphate isomerase/epimerase